MSPFNDSATFDVNEAELCAPYHSYDVRTFVMFSCLAPLMILFGLASNCINLLAFTDSRMRFVLINWYLIGLALCDIIILSMSFLMLSLPTIADYTQSWRWIETSNHVTRWIYPVAVIAQTEAVGLTVLVAGHRCLGVCFPFRGRMFTADRVKFCLVLLSLFALVYNFPRFFEINLTPCWSEHFNVTLMSMVTSELRQDPIYLQFFVFWSYTIIMFALPFLLLIITSVLTVTAVRKSRRSSALRKFHGGQQGDSENKKELNTTMMLIGIVLEFLVFNSFAFFTNILEFVINNSLVDESNNSFQTLYSISADVANFAVLSNSSFNIFIYYRFSKKFRDVLKSKWERRRSSSALSTSGNLTTSQRLPLLPLRHRQTRRTVSVNSSLKS